MGMENLAAAMLVYLMKNVDQNAEWARLKKHGCGCMEMLLWMHGRQHLMSCPMKHTWILLTRFCSFEICIAGG